MDIEHYRLVDDELILMTEAEVEASHGYYKIINGYNIELTQEEIDAFLAECEALKEDDET